MANLATALTQLRRSHLPNFTVNDLKAEFRGRFYATQALKLLPDFADPLMIDTLFTQLSLVGAVHL